MERFFLWLSKMFGIIATDIGKVKLSSYFSRCENKLFNLEENERKLNQRRMMMSKAIMHAKNSGDPELKKYEKALKELEVQYAEIQQEKSWLQKEIINVKMEKDDNMSGVEYRTFIHRV